MKRKQIIILGTILLVGFAGYQAFNYFISAPLYTPEDLTQKAEYRYLLQSHNLNDTKNTFQISDTIALNYFTQGNGEPILVLHGGPGIPYKTPWNGLDSLTNKFKFYYYDQRGCGKSSRPFNKFQGSFYENMMQLHTNLGLPAQIADIEQIRKKIGVEKITIIGHSFGGFLASLYAIEFPERVKKLVLVSPANVIKMPNNSKGLYDAVEERLPQEMKKDYANYLDKFMNFGSIFEKSEQELVSLNKEFVKYYKVANGNQTGGNIDGVGGWAQFAMFFSMGKKHDYSEALKNISVPTLIIHGTDDIIPIESVNDYFNNIPYSELKLIDKSGHFPFYQQPVVFNKILKNWIEK